ncbi:MAG: DUF167 domain-containing protein [Pirellulales bacterium]|nr:DUF167 domain-containing protein [Pirellulales bacterium]
MTEPVKPHAEGSMLGVYAQPGARRNQLRGIERGMLKLSVTQVAELGRANEAIKKLLASSLGLRKSQLELVAGQSSREKRFLVRCPPDELQRRLVAALAAEDQN